jgi:hypothetical protein
VTAEEQVRRAREGKGEGLHVLGGIDKEICAEGRRDSEGECKNASGTQDARRHTDSVVYVLQATNETLRLFQTAGRVKRSRQQLH